MNLEEGSDALRAWITDQAWPLVATLDDRFARVRYFAVSAQGHPDEGQAFQPRGLLAPCAGCGGGRWWQGQGYGCRPGGRTSPPGLVRLETATRPTPDQGRVRVPGHGIG